MTCISDLVLYHFFPFPSALIELLPAVYAANPVLTLFIGESGSHFDTVCNEIQNEPTSVSPSSLAVMNGTLSGFKSRTTPNMTVPDLSDASVVVEVA